MKPHDIKAGFYSWYRWTVYYLISLGMFALWLCFLGCVSIRFTLNWIMEDPRDNYSQDIFFPSWFRMGDGE